MKLFAPLIPRPRNLAPSYPIYQQWGGTTPQAGYLGHARAYTTNEVVYACIEMLATSAGEPHIVGRKWQRNSPTFRDEIRNEARRLLAAGYSHREVKAKLIANGFYKPMTDHPLIRLLDSPNPWTSRGQLWGTVVMDRALAGNAYLFKSRIQQGPLKGAVGELWRLRPDRVKIIPSKTNFIDHYEYGSGADMVPFPPGDIIHFKTRNPLNDYYGQSQLIPLLQRLAIEDNMKAFLQSFYEKGGTGPGAVLTLKGELSDEAKEEIRDRKNRMFSNIGGASEWLILDNAESTFTPLGLNRGLRDALPKEISDTSSAYIAVVFGVPASILGIPIGMESSSYANKRQDWQVFWDLTMTPLLSDLDDVLNLQLTPDFGGIDEVLFDLSDIRALQEDVDKIQKRHRDNLIVGGESWEEFRECIGLDPKVKEGTFLIPSNMVPVRISQGVLEMPEPEPLPAPQIPERTDPVVDIVAEVHCPKCGRWVGRNMNVGATAYCPKDKEVPVERPDEKPLTIEIVRDEEGRAAQLVATK